MIHSVLEVVLSRYFTNTIVCLICITGALSLVSRAQKYKVMGKAAKKITATWEKFLHYASEATEKRIREEEQLQKLEGKREKKHFIYRLDEMLLQTGIKKKFPFLTVELTMLIMAVFFLIVLMVVTEAADSILLGMLSTGILFMVFKESARMVIRHRQRKVEDNIIQFANLIENYAKTSDDIVKILYKISVYLEEPLKTAVEACYTEAFTTGDFSTACAHLDASIGNRYLSAMLTNIESCSRHRANYEEVIHGNKEIIRKYIAERDVQREISRNARMEIMLVLIMGGIVIFSFQSTLPETSQILGGSMTGKIISFVIGVVLFISFRVMVSIGAEEE